LFIYDNENFEELNKAVFLGVLKKTNNIIEIFPSLKKNGKS